MSLTNVWIFIAYLYLLPPFLFRFLSLFYKKNKMHFTDDDSYYYFWWFGVQLQVIYLRFPFLEELIKMVPTLYSRWLRLWGGKIGRNIYWSANVKILDRAYLNLGDGIVFGYGASLSSHYIINQNKRANLYLSEIIIGDYAMVGGVSMMGAGSRLGAGDLLPARKTLLPFQEIIKGRKTMRSDIDIPSLKEQEKEDS